MTKYKVLNKYNEEGELLEGVGGILEMETGKGIPLDPANVDYQAYLAWLAEGNTPEPAEE
jgi:hypothetical protein